MSNDCLLWLAKFETENDYLEFYYKSSKAYPDLTYECDSNEKDDFYNDEFTHEWLSIYFKLIDSSQNHFISSAVHFSHLALVEKLAAEQGVADANAVIGHFGSSGISDLDAISYLESWASTHTNQTLWFLGELSEQTMKSNRVPLSDESLAIDDNWWSQIPQTKEQLDVLEQQAESGSVCLPARVKLFFMVETGVCVENNPVLAKGYLKHVHLYPELLHRCYKANGEAGNADSWLQLFHLHAREFDASVSDEDRVRYLENACLLGSQKAKKCLAAVHVAYGYSALDIERDHFRSEALLLELYEAGSTDPWEPSHLSRKLCHLYSMPGTEIYNREKSIYWNNNYVNQTGDFATLAHSFLNDNTEVGYEVLMCKAIYLAECNKSGQYLDSRFIRKLDAVDIASIKSGRTEARQWLKEFEDNSFALNREIWDPFEQYLADRKKTL